jgi:DNA-binding response OmpR family regulator
MNATRTRGRRLLDWFIGQPPREHPAAAARVLVVDDDAVIRSLLVVALSIEGFEVFEAGDGRAALDLIASARPDIAIIDAMMPEISGCDVALRLHADPATVDIKVLLLVAHDAGGDTPPATALGVDAWLAKPFEPEEVIAVLRRLSQLTA